MGGQATNKDATTYPFVERTAPGWTANALESVVGDILKVGRGRDAPGVDLSHTLLVSQNAVHFQVWSALLPHAAPERRVRYAAACTDRLVVSASRVGTRAVCTGGKKILFAVSLSLSLSLCARTREKERASKVNSRTCRLHT